MFSASEDDNRIGSKTVLAIYLFNAYLRFIR